MILSHSISGLAGIAGLFHDFGKASQLFQDGLTGKAKHFQPLRHEWVSLRLFAAFVNGRTDQQWLEALAAGDYSTPDILAQLPDVSTINPMAGLPPIAATVGWLIVSHHRLPTCSGENQPSLASVPSWLADQFCSHWGYQNGDEFTPEEMALANTFAYGLPTSWPSWQRLARSVARKALRCYDLSVMCDNAMVKHLARLALIAGDHYGSGLPGKGQGALWANTDKVTKKLNQTLEEHLICVTRAAVAFARQIPALGGRLPALQRHIGLETDSKNQKFEWQNYAAHISDEGTSPAFFGINMASTGCGKTYANIRIMYALNNKKPFRMTVALGLRALTLQTCDAFKSLLGLRDEDLAVAVGGDGVRQLHALRRDDVEVEEGDYVVYPGQLDGFEKLEKVNKSLAKLLVAPVLVSTIDHLMPASESLRGGKQIAPMLRLLTSDLVLDEPDDFDVADQHALCRLVYFAGLMGSRVLLSSATIVPSLGTALYDAYRAGFESRAQALGLPQEIQVGFYDENDAMTYLAWPTEGFFEHYTRHLKKRADYLATKPALRRAALLDVNSVDELPAVIRNAAMQLHEAHHNAKDGKRVSIGIVRFANIKPLIAAAQALMSMPAQESYRFMFCVYHSQHPLIMRSNIEAKLDATLNRKKPRALFKHREIKDALRGPAKDVICIVLATSVAEVGRDWDADWAIAEPSSMRSLIQLAGRVQRHRQQLPDSPNMLILNKNVRALSGRRPAFCMPGFENNVIRLPQHDLHQILSEEDYREISSIPRLKLTDSMFAKIEHARTSLELLGRKSQPGSASQFWQQNAAWCGEFQRRWPFRKSADDEMQLHVKPDLTFYADDGDGLKESADVRPVGLELAEGNSVWFSPDYGQLFAELGGQLGMDNDEIARLFGGINIRQGGEWLFHPVLGIFKK
ncbi:type I-F CRISPR-associated helicase Cas3 [Salmonella enterica]|nr:type I-F CRISPR-associated helicase Cas3 [Salmonella enterica]